MILINYINEEIKQIKYRFYERIKHPYITKFLEAPVLDEDMLYLLYSMLEEKKLAKQKLDEYVITTLLVQAALDTHQKVSVSNVSSERVKKERQLKVLAGDYYSSLYYFLLAKINDITMIRLLANSIQEINESKMSFYKDTQSISQSIAHIKIIDSSLIQKIAEHFKLPNWKAIVSEFFFFKRLITEREALLQGHDGLLIETIVKDNSSINSKLHGDARLKHSIEMCDKYIFLSKSQLHSLCRQASPLSSFIMVRIDEMLMNADLLKEEVAEEG
ncbi:MAG: heptaprenyl diphosphate synthase component 1 [Anaerobacillus sp.]|uniref:heptaprenyl diphosphate synthase component 1 n=1 Tax=Anaerobacillus sp. TaxID=1872506 RepID=UPI00391D7A44